MSELAEWQEDRLKRFERRKEDAGAVSPHLADAAAARGDFDGGSLYWVIKGFVLVRRAYRRSRADIKDDGTACCGIVLGREVSDTSARSAAPRLALSRSGGCALRSKASPRLKTQYHRGMREALRRLRLMDW